MFGKFSTTYHSFLLSLDLRCGHISEFSNARTHFSGSLVSLSRMEIIAILQMTPARSGGCLPWRRLSSLMKSALPRELANHWSWFLAHPNLKISTEILAKVV